MWQNKKNKKNNQCPGLGQAQMAKHGNTQIVFSHSHNIKFLI